ncbi:MAG: Na+/H+ antiporter NhaA [Cytophagales bacterium]
MKKNKLKFINFREFLESQQAGGVILILCTIASLLLANSPLAAEYGKFWEIELGFEIGSLHLKHHLLHWINDGLMAVFFLFVGLEIKRELLEGELSDIKAALLPVLVALGGMLVPSLFYILFNLGATGNLKGFGIPMATDIAFALGALSLLGDKIPNNLKVFLMALAVIDDLGAIVVIAVGYGSNFSVSYILASIVVLVILIICNRFKVKSILVYLSLGLVLWFCMLHSGIHATIAGVLLALCIPFDVLYSEKYTLPAWLVHHLHNPINYVIMPIFAIANTAITLSTQSIGELNIWVSLGIFVGLFLGKVFGILGTTYFAVQTGISKLPENVTWHHVIGMGFLGGIGFTMSIFVTTLAFSDHVLIENSKLVIILSSTLSGIVGYLYLKYISKSLN